MNVLTETLRDPQSMAGLTAAAWFELKVQAEASGLLGRIWYLAQREGIAIPAYASWHFSAAAKLARRQQTQALRDLTELSQLFAWLEVEWVLLKGAAYIALELPVAEGRTFADIDILIPRNQLNRVERHLHMRHWVRSDVDDYDERYYREWMHEIPPLRHTRRGTVLDVHHNILPLTNRDAPDISRFELQRHHHPRLGPVTTLSDLDLCIHSAVHLFAEGEYHNGLRDLSDLDLLLCRYSARAPDFVPRLRRRAAELGLQGYTEQALFQCRQLLQTRVGPEPVAPPGGALGGPVLALAFKRVFTPAHSSCRLPGHRLAAFFLYCRGHLLRMPLRLLLPHLWRKSWRRLSEALQQGGATKQGL